MRLPIAIAILLVATLAPAPAAASASGADDQFRPGAPGVGDAYYPLYGNGGYDVRHYRLKFTYQPATDRLDGVARITARATQNLSRFNLDLQGLTVRSVRVDGERARWRRSQDHELIVTPRHGLARGEKFVTTVRYDGVPRTQVIPGFDIEAGFIATDDGAVVAGQPEVAANWFPVNDHPIDKAAYTFLVTVPAGLEVIANGHLRGHRTKGAWTTWRWVAPEPMASYLATATIGEFDVDSYRFDGIEMHDAIDPDLYAESTDPEDPASPTFGEVAAGALANQGKIMSFLADVAGPYPFGSGGGLVDDYDGLFFALETQTRSVYSKYFFTDPIGGDFVVVHEVAHQWYGDSVSIAKWKHIWLNEGFATYAEWLWSEQQGMDTAQETFDFFYNEIPPDDPFWSVVIGDPGVASLFDFAVYARGAMTLHQLRLKVGEDAFFAIMRRWAEARAGGHGTTAAFIRLAERISGQQLDELFETWLFTPGRPDLAGASTASRAAQALVPRASLRASSQTDAPAAAVSLMARYRR